MPRLCSTALAGARSARSGTTGSPTSASFGRSSLMNAVVPGSPERALFFPHFLTTCRKLAVSTATLALVAAAAWAGRSWLLGRMRSSEAAPATPATVRVVTLAPEVVVSALHYSAAVKEFEKAELSFRLGGTVESLLQVAGPDGQMHRIHEGDRVPRGSVLARLDPADYRRDRDEAAETLAKDEAQLAKDDASSELSRNNLRRAEELASSGGISKEEVDSRRQTVKMSEAAVAGDRRDVESARIKLQQAEANLAYCTLTAPFAEGTVAARDDPRGGGRPELDHRPAEGLAWMNRGHPYPAALPASDPGDVHAGVFAMSRRPPTSTERSAARRADSWGSSM